MLSKKVITIITIVKMRINKGVSKVCSCSFAGEWVNKIEITKVKEIGFSSG